MKRDCTPAYAILVRLGIPTTPGAFAAVAAAIDKAGGDLADMTTMEETRGLRIRELTINARNTDHQQEIVAGLKGVEGVQLHFVKDVTFALHEGGKIDTGLRSPLTNAAALSQAYTPGVARVCKAVEADPERSFRLTIRQNMVAVVSDGTAVLGLGDIGPEGAMPVMEGKAMLFKAFGNVDAFPICVDTKDPDEIIAIVKALAPTFGGINLEDISAPRCFEIEDRLKEMLDIPVFHDDQHGTAVVLLAALTNALKLVDKKMEDLKIVFSGVGAAGVACTKLLQLAGVTNIIGCDRSGSLYEGRTERMNVAKEWYAANTNPEKIQGSLSDVMDGADVFVGLSGPDTLTVEDVKKMASKAIVFAMSNPDPEIAPELALPHVAVMATGRSDYPNQINNVLAFPGIFRGALDCRARAITDGMKVAAAKAIASVVEEDGVRADYVIPSPFDARVGEAVARVVRETAIAEEVARSCADAIPGVDDLL